MRYLIGIDLGTTNSAVAFCDTEKPHVPIELFAIPQLTAPGKVNALPTLPSFCYLLGESEWPPGSLKLPWKEETETFVGQWAKLQGARVPTRLVQSAKSWLCNVAANRRDKILPLEVADLAQRLSPVEAAARYLGHIREAWNATMAKNNPQASLEEQEVIVTVPASFDEVARTLTVEAARLAGFGRLTLLEEPQAAFYSWIAQNEKDWQADFQAGECILVCDVGGGTTDFSLIEVQSKDGQLGFQRLAVGNHLLLGGDNMDATLAHQLEAQLGEHVLSPTQWLQLQAAVRTAKETLLASEADSDRVYPIVLQGTGSAVVSGSLSLALQRREIEDLLLTGFFGRYSLEEALQLQRSQGIQTMGLPYEAEPSITKHMAHFLQQTKAFSKLSKIDYILFNGGVLKPKIFQNSLVESLTLWFKGQPPQVLPSYNLDLAVAHGAAYFGKVRRGLGTSIGGGLPRTYYLELDVTRPDGTIERCALTLVPRGSEEGYLFEVQETVSLRANAPVTFALLASNVRLNDRPGELIVLNSQEIQRLAPIQTILRFGKSSVGAEIERKLPVRLGVRLTEVGTLELWLTSQVSNHRWELAFQLRAMTGQEDQLLVLETKRQDETFASGELQGAQQIIEECFKENSGIKPSRLMEQLETAIGLSKLEWPPSVLRALWDPLLRVATQRKRSPEHETRWWNLVGFVLRPGFGVALDDFRLKEFWKIYLADSKSTRSQECQVQIWICCRRIAGGLGNGQQTQLASEWITDLFDKKTRQIAEKRKNEAYAYAEKIRALGSFERLDIPLKARIGDSLVHRLCQAEWTAAEVWALGRIGARQPLYASAGQVIPRDTCERWIKTLLSKVSVDHPLAPLLFGELARKTAHRELNIHKQLIDAILARYSNEQLAHCLHEGGAWTKTESEQLWGDQLPPGLILELA